jgi:hypothetical protein
VTGDEVVPGIARIWLGVPEVIVLVLPLAHAASATDMASNTSTLDVVGIALLQSLLEAPAAHTIAR